MAFCLRMYTKRICVSLLPGIFFMDYGAGKLSISQSQMGGLCVIHLEYQGDMCVSRSPIYINVGGVRVGMGGVHSSCRIMSLHT